MQATSTALPVTVSITRRADPARSGEMVAWMRAGTALAENFPGCLGAGWVRPAADSPDWHMLYRFADDAALRRWEESPQRRWWLYGRPAPWRRAARAARRAGRYN
jgi:hypothetical protein